MPARTLKDRLLKDFADIRSELMGDLGKVDAALVNYSPSPEHEMKTFLGHVREIATMERLCIGRLIDQTPREWDKAFDWTGEDLASAIADLQSVREITLGYLTSLTDAQIGEVVALPPQWHQYMGPEIEREEMFRWVARHEYYHLGQIVIYRWILGDNPYEPAG